MRRVRRLAVWTAVLLLGMAFVPARAERVTEGEARTAAQNYVQLVLAREGTWGEEKTAQVIAIRPFSHGARQLGYFCQVEPAGYIVLPLSKDLPPVCAYSVYSNPDPDAEQGMLYLLKARMEGAFATLERREDDAAAPGNIPTAPRPARYAASWQALTSGAFDAAAYYQGRPARGAGMDYVEGQTLLTSRWHQQPPYNDDCPDMDCEWPGYDDFNENVVVGCVATAASQILRHWRWPPEGVGSPYDQGYDFPRMCNEYVWDDTLHWFRDENGTSVTQNQIDAVAKLCSDVGVSIGMSYGCGGSGAHDPNLESALQSLFRYDGECDVQYGDEHSYDDWFLLLKNDLNQNRVVEFWGGAPSVHAIAVDGWKEEWVGDDYRMVHAIFGLHNLWDENWYTLDTLLTAPQDLEGMVREIFPDCSLGTTVDGTWPVPTYPYRYFNRDASAQSATFAAGHNLPILRSGFLLSNTGTATPDVITFNGTTTANTLLYLYGDPAGESRIRVRDGAIKVHAGGQLAVF